jgi:hypothetical protein
VELAVGVRLPVGLGEPVDAAVAVGVTAAVVLPVGESVGVNPAVPDSVAVTLRLRVFEGVVVSVLEALGVALLAPAGADGAAVRVGISLGIGMVVGPATCMPMNARVRAVFSAPPRNSTTSPNSSGTAVVMAPQQNAG